MAVSAALTSPCTTARLTPTPRAISRRAVPDAVERRREVVDETRAVSRSRIGV
ncbi:hypothetical protein IOD16_18330 [Saccharothrix sp. 6-C]|uniref:hypothetical protein n=1 Tax=Saccharothrix sp. 6-C TaxID=2781735 RepID=UPI00191748E5|nr:hypothetical protein [Saccharothrix sp. 6-C]QQQ80167.1 hypothetical protein IOD16_18330 [Saccharothrix sp. 6-C]